MWPAAMREIVQHVSPGKVLGAPFGRMPAARVGRLAIRSLYREAALAPKPGLVSPSSQGSHRDMDFSTFLRSLQALRPYFPAIATCGLRRPRFLALRLLGIEAKARA